MLGRMDGRRKETRKTEIKSIRLSKVVNKDEQRKQKSNVKASDKAPRKF